QRSGDGLVGAAGLDEGHHLALVVAGAARHDDLAAVGRGANPRRKRRLLPQIERIDRLHVVVAVEQDAWALAVPTGALMTTLGDHDRMPLRRAHARVKANA